MKMAAEISEWSIDIFWGKLALISKGDPTNPPVLLVHGYMDTAATFFPLLEKMPNSFYYVGFDFPGNGKSDPYPPGLPISHGHLIEILRIVVEHLKWKHFVYLGHSLGFIIGSYYNAICPGKIVKMINIDPSVTMPWHYYAVYEYPTFSSYYYGFFMDYDSNNSVNRNKTYKYSDAVALLARNRNLTEEQSQAIISRSLVPVGRDLYRFSWQRRLKNLTGLPVNSDLLLNVITAIKVPILNIHAAAYNQSLPPETIQFGIDLFEKIRNQWSNVKEVSLDGGHDIHITHAEACAMHIENFLNSKSNTNSKAKL